MLQLGYSSWKNDQLSQEEFVAVLPGSSALTAALEPLKVVSRGQSEPPNLLLLNQKSWKFYFTVTTGF